ncbi:hypothetical protein GobsT_42770 [Gemmata obscuriglobus]|uniref:Uncharacterized protein n=1 Tax=Gemmata obscuriglobus TaxID=114 RepID=A0A2Z3H1W9_9BACT|nr:hypothetical protein [Gemmata obscuriglobus]AWM37707.1 hypothetical protein C1280_12385 [Gemmata obscuriglobus]QEG29481.1 hypothetical protein GobsT_42770 [Gemmata obscuriglobus]VTS08635.1 unnamed protein product [Gemmata obscuriglobus UQM 2246]
MTPDLRIQQAVVTTDGRNVQVAAQTGGFDTPEAERIAVLFGPRPDGVACPGAVFACPFGTSHVAVVRVEDRPGPVLGFRFLVLARELYRHLGDPFAIADRYPPDWDATGTLADLAWPHEVLPERTLEQLDAVLKSGDSPLLLGSTQALVDGNRVLLTRAAPALFVRDLWQLLPDRTRCDLWPATFAFSDELGFHAAVGPTLPTPRHGVQVLVEEAIRDYPSSSYELNLQLAIESGDRAALRRLLARRTADDTIRIGLYALAFALIVAVVLRVAF